MGDTVVPVGMEPPDTVSVPALSPVSDPPHDWNVHEPLTVFVQPKD
jgi:hypothetical protein